MPQLQHPASVSCIDLPAPACLLLLVLLSSFVVLAPPPAHAQTFQIIHTFTGGQDGATPLSGLTKGPDGSFYGTTADGGVGYGTVYKLARQGSGWVMKPLYEFRGLDGAGPNARVIFGPDGNLYGTTTAGGEGTCTYAQYRGCGTVFRLQPPASVCKAFSCPWTATTIYNAQPDGGRVLFGEVVFDQAGNLYTTVAGGGQFDEGYVVELSHSGGTWTSNVLYNFDPFTGNDGGYPRAGLVIDQAGNLYGTTNDGGLDNGGIAFQLSLTSTGWKETVLQDFHESNGFEPQAPLIFDSQGNLYGTTFDLGPNGGGVVFELSPSNGGWTFSLPFAFNDQGGTGSVLVAPASLDANGNIWGTTFETGCCGWGVVYELTPSGGGGWSETVEHYFTSNDGSYPYSNVVFDAQGNAYGTASYGGAGDNGVIWEITP